MALLRPISALFRLCIVCSMLAISQIWMHKIRSILTTIGIMIGVASVSAVIAFLTGLENNVVDSFEKAVGSNRIFLQPHYMDSESGEWRHEAFEMTDFDRVYERCPSVRYLCREHTTGGTIQSATEMLEDAQITGIDPNWHELNDRVASLGRNLTELDNERQRSVCVLDEALRDRLKLDIDCVHETIHLAGQPFQIVGILPKKTEEGMFSRSGETHNVYIPVTASDALFHSGYLRATATAKSTHVVDDARAELRFFLRTTRRVKPDEDDNFRVESMGHHLEEFRSIAGVVTAIAAGIVGISLLVGGVGVMNVMLASVSERTREIGLRKAVGARPFAIMLQFLIESVVLCISGGLLGLLAGKGLTMLMVFVPEAKLKNPEIPLWAIALSLGFTSLVGVVFGLFPAIKAARLDPIKALRHE